jgi:hypothetical protein
VKQISLINGWPFVARASPFVDDFVYAMHVFVCAAAAMCCSVSVCLPERTRISLLYFSWILDNRGATDLNTLANHFVYGELCFSFKLN